MRGTTTKNRESLLQEFVSWSAAHITGDEKGQAQIFLDRLFQAFGQRGSLDVGGTAEMRIRNRIDAWNEVWGQESTRHLWMREALLRTYKDASDKDFEMIV